MVKQNIQITIAWQLWPPIIIAGNEVAWKESPRNYINYNTNI